MTAATIDEAAMLIFLKFLPLSLTPARQSVTVFLAYQHGFLCSGSTWESVTSRRGVERRLLAAVLECPTGA
ncbi:hypothetical protein GCM10017667_39840 [Streptomyces filamentosus]|uniref:Uncharacterized protein n=1 Tax=Streptomyces filamentosus TaxID=67294 RepID=A0A919BPN8_STRFL|nr:hypothetical protein GCM10017667_39840 [Streptomyces filamentosus]